MKNKKLTQKQIDKRHHILTIVKWVGVCLGWSVLLAGFIGLLVIGIRGCYNKTNMPPKTNITTPVNRHNGEPNNITSGSVNYISAGEYYYNGFNVLQTADISQSYDTSYQVGGYVGDIPYYFITTRGYLGPTSKTFRIRFWTSDTTYLEQFAILRLADNVGWFDNNDINFGTIITIDKDIDNGYPLTWWFYHATYDFENYDIEFNNQINYFAPLGYNIDYFAQGNYAGTYPLVRGLFADSEGVLYSEISITYINGHATAYGSGGSDYHVNDNENSVQFLSLNYKVYNSNTLIVVNSADFYTTTNSSHSGSLCLSASSHWTSAIYQKLHIYYTYANDWDNELGHYDTLPSGNTSRKGVLSSFNNSINITGIVGGDNIGNGLTLVGNAFSSLAGIFGIYVLPGITFGVLLFIPLLVGITLAIVKLLRK